MPKLWVPQGFKVNKPPVKSAIKMENGDGDAQMKVEPVELEKIQSPSNDSKDGAGDEKPANPTKDKKPKTAIVDAQSTQKKAWYDDDHLWLGDKVCRIKEGRHTIDLNGGLDSASQMWQNP
jgi:hypothetical protein